METYKTGDTISLNISLKDVSGIDSVVAAFRGVNEQRQIWMRGNGDGQTSATVVLQVKVDPSILSDEYYLQMLFVKDKVGNQKEHLREDIRFRIERTTEDTDAPEIESVSLG